MEKTLPKAPPVGEETGKQRQTSANGVAGLMNPNMGAMQPKPRSFKTWREMRGNPTLALARVAATAPIRTASVGVEGDPGTTAARRKIVEDVVDSLWPTFIHNAIFSLEFGFQAFEKVWQIDENGWQIRKLKPLAPEMTKVVTSPKDGGFEGLKQGDVHLEPIQSLLVLNGWEAGSVYGRSRYENVREWAWTPWMDVANKRMQYLGKISGITPMVEYPPGSSKDATGGEQSNFKHAQAILRHLGNGNGVAMPNTLASFAEDLARKGVSLKELRAWQISFLETKGNHAAGYAEAMRYYDALMLRGWLVPERAVTEGQFGTKAEAGEHASIALSASMLTLSDFITAFNHFVVDPVLTYNAGAEFAGTVRVVTAGMSADEIAFYRKILETVFSNTANVDLLLTMLDMDAMIDAAGLPKSPGFRKALKAQTDPENKPAPPTLPKPPPPVDGEADPDGNGKGLSMLDALAERWRLMGV